MDIVIAAPRRVARVDVDYSQYWVAAGPDLDEAGDSIPGLLISLGPQGVAVITGLQAGQVSVAAQVVAAQPTAVEPGWDVVGETDLDCPEGIIAVMDWGGPDHPELGELAPDGPGRYRLHAHARRREPVSGKHSREEHYLLLWPATDPAPSRLLTPMDEWGRAFSGAEPAAGSSGPDDLDLAAALPVHPTSVDIRLRRQGRSETTVRLEHRNVPAEFADPVKPFWDWALRHLHDLLNKVRVDDPPWNR